MDFSQIYIQALLLIPGMVTVLWVISVLALFKSRKENKGKVMDKGLWRYTRHPNYFGDAAVWWGFGLISIAAGGYYQAFGAILMTLLLVKVSGVAMLEKTLKDKGPAFSEYKRRTSAFIPWFPKK
jgi:steroid 5-alpha reductase family enzyme